MTAAEPEARITELEIRLAHQERMLEELSDVIARQDRTIDVLTARVRRLSERMEGLETGGWRPSPQDDKPPPHY